MSHKNVANINAPGHWNGTSKRWEGEARETTNLISSVCWGSLPRPGGEGIGTVMEWLHLVSIFILQQSGFPQKCQSSSCFSGFLFFFVRNTHKLTTMGTATGLDEFSHPSSHSPSWAYTARRLQSFNRGSQNQNQHQLPAAAVSVREHMLLMLRPIDRVQIGWQQISVSFLKMLPFLKHARGGLGEI